MVVDAASVAHETKVTIGIRTKDKMEITSGLQGGETVVIEGNFSLRTAPRLRLQRTNPHQMRRNRKRSEVTMECAGRAKRRRRSISDKLQFVATTLSERKNNDKLKFVEHQNPKRCSPLRFATALQKKIMILARLVSNQSRAVLVVIALICAGGLYAAWQLPIAIFPATNFPRIVIIVDNGVAPGPQTLVSVTRPIEEAMNGIPGIQRIKSENLAWLFRDKSFL